jgi:hypothetical protein
LILVKHVPPLFSPKGFFISAILSDDIEELISGEKNFLCPEKYNYNYVIKELFEFGYSRR